MSECNGRKQQNKHRTPATELALRNLQEAALHYAMRKIENPETEREPLTQMEKDAVEFLKKQNETETPKDDLEPGNN